MDEFADLAMQIQEQFKRFLEMANGMKEMAKREGYTEEEAHFLVLWQFGYRKAIPDDGNSV